MILIPLLAIAGILVALHLRLGRHVELTLFSTISSVTLIAYFSALLGVLRPACLVMTWGGILALAISIMVILRDAARRRVAADLLSPGILVLVLGMIAFWIRYRTLCLHDAGEFNLWGIVPRYLLVTNHLWDRNSTLDVDDYAPGAAVFQYFVCFLAPYRESHVYLAKAVLLFAPVSALFSGMSWRQPIWILLGVATVLLAVCCFDGWCFPSLHVDTLSGIYAGMALLAYLGAPRDVLPRRLLLLYVPILSVMPIIKRVGLLLGGFVLLIYVVETLVRPVKASSRWLRLSAAVLLGACMLLSHKSWSSYLQREGIQRVHDTQTSRIGWDELVRAFTSKATPPEKVMRNTFLRAMIHTPIVWEERERRLLPGILAAWLPRMNVIAWGLLLTILAFTAVRWAPDPDVRAAYRVVAIMLFPLLFAYLLINYLIYMFVAINSVSSMWPLESFERYMGIFMVGFLLVVMGMLFRVGMHRGPRACLACAALVGGLLAYESPDNVFVKPLEFPAQGRPLERAIFEAKLHVPQDGRLAMVYQGSRLPWERMIVRYELVPRYINKVWSLGPPSNQWDNWSRDLSAEEWARLLKENGDQYVLVLRGSPLFWERYGCLFAPERRKEDVLFRVEDSGQEVQLVPIPASLWSGEIPPGERQPLVRDRGHAAPLVEVRVRTRAERGSNDMEETGARPVAGASGALRLTREGGAAIEVPPDAFGNEMTEVRLDHDGSSEVRMRCETPQEVLSTAADAIGWELGYLDVLHLRSGDHPLTFSLASPLPLEGATINVHVKNYASLRDTVVIVDAWSDDTHQHAVEEGSARSPDGVAEVTFGRSVRGWKRIHLGVSLRQRTKFIGIDWLAIVLRGKSADAAWDPRETRLWVENALEQTMMIDVSPGRGN